MGDALAVEEQRSLMSAQSVLPTPDTLTKLVKRLRVMTLKLLPLEVSCDALTDPTSSIITPQVIASYALAGGDFSEAVPFCLLRAKYLFMRDAHASPADFEENTCRAVACEMLARRIVHNLPSDRLESVMSTRFRYRESDGDVSPATSALETAIDQHATQFLSSNEAQFVVGSLWRGDWIQINGENDSIDYKPYEKSKSDSFWDHLEPHRLQVPRYQTALNISTWLFFLFVYCQAVQTPLDKINRSNQGLDVWEWFLYGMAFSFFVEEVKKTFKTIRLTPNPLSAIGFWSVVNLTIDLLLLTAFGLRVAGIKVASDEQSSALHLKSFQLLSCVSPLIWMKLIPVFETFKVVGVLQLVVFRMMRESIIFFILLGILAVGFAQALFALDAADGEVGNVMEVINNLLQALLGSPDFEAPNERFGYPFGMVIYYGWNLLSTVLLLNLLIALFGSAYEDIQGDSTDEYLYSFAYKTISLIRSPDNYVYVPPFNLIEIVFVIPFEFFLSNEAYAKLNKFIMSIVFCVPLSMIALFESQLHAKTATRLQSYFKDHEVEDEDDQDIQDPGCDDDDEGEICRVSFADLVKTFPNTTLSTSAVIEREILNLQHKIDALEKRHHGESLPKSDPGSVAEGGSEGEGSGSGKVTPAEQVKKESEEHRHKD